MLSRKILKYIRPERIVVFSDKDSSYFENMGLGTVLCRSGTDTDQFKPAGKDSRLQLREKYGFGGNERIALHVGHIRLTRNLGILKALADDGYTVIIIGSTSTQADKSFCDELTRHGIIVRKEYIARIEEMYQLSDLYVFPVLNDHAAIEFPLSVLEAMSCNLPVITTPYGSLPEYFSETSSGFAYFNDQNELILKSREVLNVKCNNRDLILQHFSWNNVMEELSEKLTEI
ncbi:MAG TPA: hypothetical protein DDW27_20960 [Bacteroidales bacterium]|nr:hypothetical protein [Bacteroidales bacterium]